MVLLLASIFPVKGVIAAGGMACHGPVASSVPAVQMAWLADAQHPATHAGQTHEPAAHEHDAAHEHAAHERAMHEHATHAPGASAHGPASDGAPGQFANAACLACAAICGASPLPPAAGLALPRLEPAREWHRLETAPPVGRVLAGLERPPRSL